MKKNEVSIQSGLDSKGEFEVQVDIKSKEKEDIEIILSGIKTLIGTIDAFCEGEKDKDKYNKIMKEIVGYVADDIGFSTGYYMGKLNAEIFYTKSSEPYVKESVQMELIKKYFG